MTQRVRLVLVAMISTTWLLYGCAGKKAPKPGDGSLSSESDISNKGGSSSESDLSGSKDGGQGSKELGTLPVVHFGFNEYTVSAEDREKLRKAAESLKSSGAKITIEGHCDERGSNEYNLALGERRAQSVKSYLQKLGVAAANLSTISYGEERPVDSGHGEDSWTKNRRGELVSNK